MAVLLHLDLLEGWVEDIDITIVIIAHNITEPTAVAGRAMDRCNRTRCPPLNYPRASGTAYLVKISLLKAFESFQMV